MVSIKYLGIFCLILLATGAANASRLDLENSDYGVDPVVSISCFTLDGSGNVGNPANLVSCPGGAVSAETFTAPSFLLQDPAKTIQVFDFKMNGLSNFTLTLTGTQAFFNYGGFLCDNGIGSTHAQCFGDANTPMSNVNSFTDQDGVSQAVFHVAGSGNGYVFFASLDLTPPSDNTDSLFAAAAPGVSANIQFDGTSPVPEPNSLPIIGAGLASVILWGRRRFAKAL